MIEEENYEKEISDDDLFAFILEGGFNRSEYSQNFPLSGWKVLYNNKARKLYFVEVYRNSSEMLLNISEERIWELEEYEKVEEWEGTKFFPVEYVYGNIDSRIIKR